HNRPAVQVVPSTATGGQVVMRDLLADTGAGRSQGSFELLLNESDCLSCGGQPIYTVPLRGAYSGSFTVYLLPVRVPQLGFSQDVSAVGVRGVLPGFDGIAGFRFLN